MSHMVIYRTADGQPGYHQTEELDDAVQYVERLRNTEGVDHARIFRMEEVTFDFKPYYKVEVGFEAAASAPAPAPVPAPAPAAFSPAPAPVEERGWLDAAASERPLLSPDPVVAETDSEPEPASILDSVPPPPPPPAPAAEADEGLATNGLGARRGLFGR